MQFTVKLDGAEVVVSVGDGLQNVRWLANVACSIRTTEKNAHPGSLAPSYVVAEDRILNPDALLKSLQLKENVLTVILHGSKEEGKNPFHFLVSPDVSVAREFRKTFFELLKDPRSAQFVLWSEDMTRLRIRNTPEFESTVLGDYFPYKTLADVCDLLAQVGFLHVPNTKASKTQLEFSQPVFTVYDTNKTLLELDRWREQVVPPSATALDRQREGDERSRRTAVTLNNINAPVITGPGAERAVQLIQEEVEQRFTPFLALLHVDEWLPSEPAAQERERSALHQLLCTHIGNLHRGFVYFSLRAAAQSGLNALSRIQFLRMCQELGLFDATVTEAAVGAVFDSTRFASADREFLSIKSDPSYMLFYEFITAMFRIARLKYGPTDPTLSGQMGRLLQRNLQPYAQRYFDAEYRAITQLMSLLPSPPVKFALETNRPYVERRFQTNLGPRRGVPFEAFRTLLQISGALTDTCTAHSAKRVFQIVCGLEQGAEVPDVEMQYGQFAHAIALVAGLRNGVTDLNATAFGELVDQFVGNFLQ